MEYLFIQKIFDFALNILLLLEGSWIISIGLGLLVNYSTVLERSYPVLRYTTVIIGFCNFFILCSPYTFPYSIFSASILCLFLNFILFLFSHIKCCGQHPVHEFHIFYSQTEQNLLSSLCENSEIY